MPQYLTDSLTYIVFISCRIQQCEDEFFILVKSDDVLQGVQDYLAQWQLSLNNFQASLIFNYWKLKRKVQQIQKMIFRREVAPL
jgi:hypothetical protein